MGPGKLLEMVRGRVVRWSQNGKRRLDRAATRRLLDEALLELGRRYRFALDAGQVQVPDEVVPAVEEVKGLERRLAAQEKDIEDLEQEYPSGKSHP